MKFLNTTNVKFDYWMVANYYPDRVNFEGERDKQRNITDRSLLLMTNRDITMTHENDTIFCYCPLIDDFLEVPMKSITLLVQPLK